jgi:hypothetical protein
LWLLAVVDVQCFEKSNENLSDHVEKTVTASFNSPETFLKVLNSNYKLSNVAPNVFHKESISQDWPPR